VIDLLKVSNIALLVDLSTMTHEAVRNNELIKPPVRKKVKEQKTGKTE
jgi:hypothetical protein